jgi:hypothetical protein
MTPLKMNPDFTMFLVSDNDNTLPSSNSFDVAFSSGRAWTAAELRRKGFRDLHTLWYVLLRERNLIATQMESYRRATVPFGVLTNVQKRDRQVRMLCFSCPSGPVLTCSYFFSSVAKVWRE